MLLGRNDGMDGGEGKDNCKGLHSKRDEIVYFSLFALLPFRT